MTNSRFTGTQSYSLFSIQKENKSLKQGFPKWSVCTPWSEPAASRGNMREKMWQQCNGVIMFCLYINQSINCAQQREEHLDKLINLTMNITEKSPNALTVN